MNWFENERIKWINEITKIYGFIRREHLVRKFNISIPQASKDLNKFIKLYPMILKYNLKDKRYDRIK